MVEFNQDQENWQIILSPNRAFTWRQNRLFLLIMAWIYLIISGFCLYFGMWPVLFFSGLDIVFLFAAFWWVARKNQQQIVLQRVGDDLLLESGRNTPELRMRFPLAWVAVIGVPDPLENGWASIRIGKSGQQIEISQFLNQHDRRKLWDLLKRLGLKEQTA